MRAETITVGTCTVCNCSRTNLAVRGSKRFRKLQAGVRGDDLKIGLVVAWNKEDPTAGRDDIIDIARSLARPGSVT